VSIESSDLSQNRILPKLREYIDHIPDDRVFTFKRELLRGNARRQLKSYLKRIDFQPSMKQVYWFEINKLILNEALTSVITFINLKFIKNDQKQF